MENLKNRIIEKNIISKEDFPKATNEHIHLATYFLIMSESIDNQNETTDYDVSKFNEEIEYIHDLLELKDCDKVESEKTFEPSSKIKMGIPKNIIPFLQNEIFPEMIKDLIE